MGTWRKRLRVLTNLILIVAAVAGAVVAARYWYRDWAAHRAYEQVKAEVDATVERHPQCGDYAALLASRADGPSGWKHVDRAMTLADGLWTSDTSVGRMISRSAEADWQPSAEDPATVSEFLSATDPVREQARLALSAPCIAAEITDPTPLVPFRVVGTADLRQVLITRVKLLATTSELAPARAELFDLVAFAQRINMAGSIVGWTFQQLLRREAWRLAAELTPALDCDAAFLAELSAIPAARHSNLPSAIEAQLAMFVWASKVWVLDEAPTSFGNAFSSTVYESGSQRLLTYVHALRQCDALLVALSTANSALDVSAAQSAMNGLASVGVEHPWSSLDEAAIRLWCQTDLALLAARLAFDLRVLAHSGNLVSQRGAAESMVPAELRLLWRENSVEVIPNADAAIVRLCGAAPHEPLARVELVGK